MGGRALGSIMKETPHDFEDATLPPGALVMDHVPSEDLLHSVHAFPGSYQIKAIGLAEDDFEARVVEAVVTELATPGELETSVRVTPGGRHVSLTMEMTVQSADQVRAIYAKIREVKGLTLLF